MKKVKKNKLARNTIRVRKAQKEREQEQSKPKGKKRVLARILALCSCLLLVSALVVPCFADYAPSVKPYNDAWDSFVRSRYDYWLYDVFNVNRAFYKHFTGFSDFKTMYEGATVPVIIAGDLVHTNSGYDTALMQQNINGLFVRTTILCNITLIVSNSDTEMDYCNISSFTEVQFSFMPAFYTVSFYYDDFLYSFSYTVDSTNDTAILSSVQGDGFYFDNEDGGSLDDIVVSLCMVLPGEYYVSFCNNIVKLLFGSRRTSNGDVMHIVHPRSDYIGARNMFDSMKNVSFEQEIKAYDSGVDSSYQIGYNDALSEISSGEFGEQFLGDMFSAPIKAVQGITLVQLPDGGSITLGHVFSALIGLLLVLAFIKIYSR